jgi:hypothetical protein
MNDFIKHHCSLHLPFPYAYSMQYQVMMKVLNSLKDFRKSQTIPDQVRK